MLHVITILLIYGVDTESVKCPDRCTCVETLISNQGENVGNGSNSANRTNFDGKNVSENNFGLYLNGNYKTLLEGIVVEGDDSVGEIGSTSKNNERESKKCSKNDGGKKGREFFSKYNFPTKTINNSKEIRTKRTLKSNVNPGKEVTSPNGKEAEVKKNRTESENKSNGFSVEEKKREIFTYQITCDGLRDLKPEWLRYLPNLTTQIAIRKTFFQSFDLFRKTLIRCPAEFDRLAIFSVSDSVINQKMEVEHYSGNGLRDRRKNLSRSANKSDEFLPFASLENPKLRSKPDPEIRSFDVKKFENVKVLKLVNDGITFLPRDTFRPFCKLEILNLSNNLIEFIERETFRPLVDLLQLDLHENRLIFLDELIFENLTKLIHLDVSRNSITNLAPSTFQYLTNLNVLNLARNPLSEKEESVMLLGTGKRLQLVDVSETGLKQIPGTLERSVRILNLMGNHLPSIRCGDLDSYSLLSYLNLRENKISYVEDDALGRLEFLKTLQIGQNNLFQIPRSLPNNLEILNLSRNNIRNVTNLDFINLSLLKELYLGHNQVSVIERNALDSLISLRVLDLSHNPILILPDIHNLGQLRALNLSHFTNIPESSNEVYDKFPVRSPQSIRELNLESSPLLTSIFFRDTPSLESFANLEQLDVRFSNLTTMRKDVFRLLAKLKILKVDGNPWHCGREILILSDWLKSRERENSAEKGDGDGEEVEEGEEEEEEKDDINTAHCSTPANLYKTRLVSLDERQFDVVEKKKSGGFFADGNGTIDGGKTGNDSFGENETEMTWPVRERSSVKVKNATDRAEGMRNGTVESSQVQKVNPKKWSSDARAKVNTLTWQKKKGVDSKKKLEENSGKNFTIYGSSTDQRKTTETTPKQTTDSGFRGEDFRTDKFEFLTEKADSKATPMPFKKPEAVTGKKFRFLEKEFNSHLSFFVLSSVGILVIATLTLTSVYFSRARRHQTSYRRQSQDIEVCSISTIGNDLW